MRKLMLVAALGAMAFGCSQDSPTRPSALPAELSDPLATGTPVSFDVPSVEESERQMRALLDSMARHPALSVADEFTCNAVEEVRVRFSAPGYVDGLNVGLFVKFIGIPAGTKTLRVWWDFEGDFSRFQDVAIGDGDVNPENAEMFDIETVIEHTYRRSGEYRVRVELLLQGAPGNCARNRDVVVTAGVTYDHMASFAGVTQCTVRGTFHNMGIGVQFTPPIPAGTSYTVRAQVDATGHTGPAFVAAGFRNRAGTDFFFPPRRGAAPPQTFTAKFTTTGDHNVLLIGGFVFGTAAHIRVLSIDIQGRSVGVVGSLEGTCP